MMSARSLSIGTLVAAVALAGAAPAGEPTSDQPDLGELWAAVKYCRANHSQGGAERRQYAQIIRDLKKQVWRLPPDAKEKAFKSKKSIDASGVYQGRKLDPQECAKLRETAQLVVPPKPKPQSKPQSKPPSETAGAASPEQDSEKQ